MTENAIAKEIVDAAFRIHTALGPGLLESVYDAVLAYELGRRGLRTVRQQPVPVVYEDVRIDTWIPRRPGRRRQGRRQGHRGNQTVELLAPVQKKQAAHLSPARDKRLGLLINFHVVLNQRRHHARCQWTRRRYSRQAVGGTFPNSIDSRPPRQSLCETPGLSTGIKVRPQNIATPRVAEEVFCHAP